MVILLLLISNFYFSKFLLGSLGFSTAITFHGIYSYEDWHKIFSKGMEEKLHLAQGGQYDEQSSPRLH
jgi:hypothetical protein